MQRLTLLNSSLKLFLTIVFSCLFITCGNLPFDNDSLPGNLNLSISGHILKGKSVSKIVFDSKGTAWIGTINEGIIQYDGQIFRYFNSGNSDFPNCFIRDMAVDHDDNIWIGTLRKGLIKFDGSDFTFYNTSNSPMPYNVVSAVAVDHNNVIWFSSSVFRDGGLMKFDGPTWELFTPDNSIMPQNLVRDIVVDHNNNVWVGVSGGVGKASIIKINGNNWSLYDESNTAIPLYYLGDLEVDINTNLIIRVDYFLSSLIDYSRPQLITFDGNSWKVNNPVIPSENPIGYVRSIGSDSQGNLWAGIFTDVYQFDQKWRKIEIDDYEFTGANVIVYDTQNRMWIGNSNGVYIIDIEID